MQTAQPAARTSLHARLFSLDALRGFDMIWILGLDAFFHTWYRISSGAVIRLLDTQLEHVAWEGLRFYDLIFPLFIFIAGVSLVFSLDRIVENEGRGAALKRVFIRALLLYLLGLLYYGGLSKTVGDIRLMGVLQRIALCYLFAGLLYLFLNRRGLVIALAVLLVGYWALLTFVPVPGIGAGKIFEGQNLANYIDRMYLPLFKWDGDHDPEGLLSTLPAIGTCLIGILAGILLRNETTPPQRKVFWLVGAGLAALLLGYLWGTQFPIVKKIWTSTYVLAAGGYSLLLLALFYQVMEIWRVHWPFMPFVWIGANAIMLYLAVQFIDFMYLASLFAGGPVKAALGRTGELLLLGLAVALIWLLGYTLYQRKIFLRL